MAFLASQVVLPFYTGLPEDVITNTFHWQSDGSTDLEAAADLIVPRLEAFYDACYAETGCCDAYVTWGDAIVKVYNLSDPSPRVPEQRDLDLSPATPTDANIPTECSIVLSYHAVPPVTARRRNRIYLGGWATGAASTGGSPGFPRIAGAVITDILGAATALNAANTSALRWQGHSNFGPSDTGTMWDVAGGWVDNSWDTQRRRGVDATTRTTW